MVNQIGKILQGGINRFVGDGEPILGVPNKEVFSADQSCELLGVSMSKLGQYVDLGTLGRDGATGSWLKSMAEELGIAPKVLGERYQNLYKDD